MTSFLHSKSPIGTRTTRIQLKVREIALPYEELAQAARPTVHPNPSLKSKASRPCEKFPGDIQSDGIGGGWRH
jgi:hypothetical protein